MSETRTLTYKSLSLKREDLDQLESVLLKESNYDYKEIEIRFGAKNLTRTVAKKSFKDILDDPTLPEVLQSLSVYFRGQQNNLRFITFSEYIRITINGESNWIGGKTEQIKNFLDKKKTYNFILHHYLYQMVILVILAILLTYTISNLIRISNASVVLIFMVSYGVAGFVIWRLGELYPTLKIEIQKPREGIGIKIFREIVLPLIIAIAAILLYTFFAPPASTP